MHRSSNSEHGSKWPADFAETKRNFVIEPTNFAADGKPKCESKFKSSDT